MAEHLPNPDIQHRKKSRAQLLQDAADLATKSNVELDDDFAKEARWRTPSTD